MKLRTILTTYACVGSLLLAQACSARANDPGGRPPGEGPGPGPGPVDPTEKVLKDAPFPVGAALVPALLRTNSAYAETVKNEMNSVTPENAMKMDALSLGPGQYKYTDADYLVKFAEDNGMRVHGHALVWYYIVPSWIRNFQGDRDAWIDLMTTYITDVVTHFKGKVTSWDVVNESFLDDGSWREGNDDPLKNL